MIAYVFAFAFFIYAALLIRAKPPQRAASIVAVAGGDRRLDVEWRDLRTRYAGLRDVFARVSREEGIPPDLLAGIAWVESSFLTTAVNSETKAAGLMQVMPLHHQSFGLTGDGWKDPYKNIHAGAEILKQHGYGRLPLSRALAGYGGFRRKDPSEYIAKVTSRATFISFLGDGYNVPA